MDTVEPKPDVSVVVVTYNIPRQIQRTLYSLSAAYQHHIDANDFEVIVVDNGSNPPFDPKILESLSGNFRLIRIEDAPPSPSMAINRGLAEARGQIVGVMIDGSRIATPGLLHFARHGARLYDQAVVATLGWYLGYDFQSWSMECGYDHASEDALLDAIDWRHNGYRLFEISAMDESSVDGWFQRIAESNALFLRREAWESLGGVDERFDGPGGGLVNLDAFGRALDLPEAKLVILLGEATFHQLHGGTNTNSPLDVQRRNWARWSNEYANIRGRPYQPVQPKHAPTFIGTFPQAELAHLVRAAIAPVPPYADPPLGRHFDQQQLWAQKPRSRPAASPIEAVVDLAQQEFRAGRFDAAVKIARLLRVRFPQEPKSQRLLSLIGCALDQHPLDAGHFLALGEAHRLLGENEGAAWHYRKALTLDGNLAEARAGLAATMGMSGGKEPA
jgi:glycosyltransferase involved in cell wall biosynthesis